MSHQAHSHHEHVHGKDCGHWAISHGDHIDYVHDGHLHHAHENHTDECVLEVGKTNPADCTPAHKCAGHDKGHVHAPGCGHEAIPHGDHVDYLVAGHLHHPHDGHCDHHGSISMA